MRVGCPQLAFGVAGDDVVRWRGDLCQTAHPVLRVPDAAERGQCEAGSAALRYSLAGRKDLHICQKDQAAAAIPVRRKNLSRQTTRKILKAQLSRQMTQRP